MYPINKHSTSIILTVHNQERIIERVFRGIIDNASENVKEVLVVLDGCIDRSQDIIQKLVPKARPVIKFFYTPDINEVLANNYGLKRSSCYYSIIVQDDCEILEPEFDKVLLRPFLQFKSLLAVSGRDSEDIKVENGKLIYYNMAGADVNTSPSIFSIRDSINRGPLMLNNEKLLHLNYLDEAFAPIWGDDADLSLRAYKYFNYIVGSRTVKFNSPNEWGTTRKPGHYSKWLLSHEKNKQLLIDRYTDYLAKTPKHSKDIIL